MKEEKQINTNSSKEEVSEYLFKKLKIKKETKDKIIEEDISGDILYDLDDADLKHLGFGLGPRKNLRYLLQEIKENFGENQIDVKINKNSSYLEVESFFKNNLNYIGNLNNLDGKGLLEMSDENIKKLGLNIGQSKKIIKYINYFKTLKIEEHEDEEADIIITKESGPDDVAKFLRKKLKFSENAIEALQLEGKDLFLLEEKEIDGVDELSEEEKIKLKNYLKVLKEQKEEHEEKELRITKDSTKDEVINFLKKKLKLSDKAIKALDPDADNLFILEDTDIDGENDLTEEEKTNLKNYIKEQNQKK